MAPLSDSAKGVAASFGASCLFGAMYYYATLMHPLTGSGIFGWRMLVTLPFLSLLLRATGFWPLVGEVAARLRRTPLLIFPLLVSSLLVAVQYWLFLWAPVNGRALEVSLGYLLMPLVMVLGGRLFFHDSLQRFQKLAVFLAALGVANQVRQMGGVSWEVLTVALGFPVYFIFRRKLGTDHLGGLWFDILLMMPASLYFIYASEHGTGILTTYPKMLGLIPLLGIMSATAIGCYITASRLLSLSLFGLLGYVEPVIMVAVSLLLGERIQSGEILTYAGVVSAVAVLAVGGVRHVGNHRR